MALSTNEPLLSNLGPSSVHQGTRFQPANGRPSPPCHACVVCCTVFSMVGTLLLTLLGIYIYSDLEGKILKLVPEGADPNPLHNTTDELKMMRRGQGAAVIWAACIYLGFVLGCGGLWVMRIRKSRVRQHSHSF